MLRHDAAEIERGLTDRLEALVETYFPSAIIRAGSAYPEPKDARDLGSFQIYLHGSHRGDWYRRSQGIGGRPIQLLAYALTGNHKAYREAFKEARVFLGLKDGETQKPRQHQPEPRQEVSREPRRKDAYAVWKSARPLAGSLGERYLRSRGIPFDLTPYSRLRFHPSVHYDHPSAYDQHLRMPAIVAAITGPQERFLAVWRIFLSQDGAKAAVEAPKLGMGPAKSGGAWLGAPRPVVNVCEGLETGLGVRGLTSERDPVVCLLSTSGMRGWEPPEFVKTVLIWPDGDRDRIQVTDRGERYSKSPGLSAAEALKVRLDAAGLACSIQPVPQNGKDALDLWNEWQAIKREETDAGDNVGAYSRGGTAAVPTS